jgi:hypothetical protein
METVETLGINPDFTFMGLAHFSESLKVTALANHSTRFSGPLEEATQRWHPSNLKRGATSERNNVKETLCLETQRFSSR